LRYRHDLLELAKLLRTPLGVVRDLPPETIHLDFGRLDFGEESVCQVL
jgi:hypothetical protein